MNSIEIYKSAIYEKINQSDDIDFLTWIYAEMLAYLQNKKSNNSSD